MPKKEAGLAKATDDGISSGNDGNSMNKECKVLNPLLDE
jgi:hypothetical protein